MKTSTAWLAALVLSAGAARGGEPVPTPVPATTPCPPTACAPTCDAPCKGGGWPALLHKMQCNGHCYRLKEWICHRPITGCCDKCAPNCSCTPSPYVFFLDRCQPRAGDCPPCAPCAAAAPEPCSQGDCGSCGVGRSVRDWVQGRWTSWRAAARAPKACAPTTCEPTACAPKTCAPKTCAPTACVPYVKSEGPIREWFNDFFGW